MQRQDGTNNDDDWKRVAEIVREEIARRRMSRQGLADKAKISISTLEKALAGKRSFTLPTLIRLEAALGVSLREKAAAPPAPVAAATNAPEELGSYSRPAVRWLEGRYLTLRPGFMQADTVSAYLTRIAWDDKAARLIFTESDRLDAKYAQSGFVSLPYLSSHIYLVTSDRGQFRTMVLGRPTPERVLHGILTTLFVGDGTQLVPIACPIALKLLDEHETPVLGRITRDSPHFAGARALLDLTMQGNFARFQL